MSAREAGISGRIDPGPVRHPLDGGHDITRTRTATGIRVTCRPCHWAVTVEPHHTDADLDRLDAMHAGEAA